VGRAEPRYLAAFEQYGFDLMRVQMVVRLFHPWVGGTERQAHKLAKALKDKHVDVGIVTGWWFRGTSRQEVLEGIPVFRNQTLWEMFGVKGLRRFGGYLYMLSLFFYLWRRRAEYDVLHVHGFNYHAAVAVLASRWFRHRVVIKLANSGQASDIQKMRIGQQLPLSRYLLPLVLKADRFIATSHTITEELISAGVAPARIVQLPNGVEVDSIPMKPDYALRDPIRLIFVGRLHEQKGLDVLLTAFQKLCGQYPNLHIRLQLLGDGPLRENLIRLSEQLDIAKQVDFMGMSGQVFEHLQQADIFILPSRAEGHSNALLEAMACGLPVIVSDIPANQDVIEHEANGLMFAAGDAISLADAASALLDRSDLRERLGNAARRTVESRYSLDCVADRYISLYQDLLADSSRTS
jgi:glycosyltransferase involved in cell wall biosynthesis